MMIKKAFVAVLTVALVPLATSCDDEEAQTGDLQLEYRIGSGSTTCEDEGIVNIHFYVMSGTTTVTDDIFPCDPDDQAVLFEDVAAGSYTIKADGLNSESVIIYTGEIATAITVEANATNDGGTVILNQIPPALQVFVDFDEAGNCASFEVTDIMVVVYEHGGSEQYRTADGEGDCVTVTNDSVLVPDLNESSTYDLRVRGANDNGEYTYEYNEDDIAVAPGEPSVIEANLVACSPAPCEDP